MKYEIRTNVLNGNLKRNRNLILNALNVFEGQEITITLQKSKKRRSTPQNAYYWSCLIPITQQAVKNEWGEVWTKELCHDFYKAKFLYHEKVNEVTGEIAKIPKSTTENTTTEQENYHTDIRTFLKEWFNVDAPLPNENILLDFKD